MSCLFSHTGVDLGRVNHNPWCNNMDNEFEYNPRRRFIPLTDSVELVFRPLDCAEYHSWIETEGGVTFDGFNSICVGVEKGEKPQIRMQNSFEIFNITHSATFENIEFTGEDLMVESYNYLT